MNHLLQVTVYTGQQLVFEALQRWLQRPCVEAEAQRQRRTSIRGLFVLLLKTAATGVVATLLDAAIEYRHRQLLSIADVDGASSPNSSNSLTGFGLGLSRAGITAWKARLLMAIDEMERQAQNYGIEPTRRFESNQKPDAAFDGNNTRSLTKNHACCTEHVQGVEERQASLAATVEQLQQLVKLGGDEQSEEILNQKIDALLDTFIDDGPATLSAANLQSFDDHACVDNKPSSTCHICMDRPQAVKVLGCNHDVCFQCARRLCAGEDHAVPQCPFCRRPIDGWTLSSRSSSAGSA